MTWTKLSDTALDDPALVELDRGVRLLHLEATVWSNRHGTDGAVPRRSLSRITDELDPQDAAARLVEAGKWEATPTGWRIVGFLTDQIPAAEVARRQALTAERQRRWRDHRDGIHDRCNPETCKASRNPSSDASRNAAPPVPPARPVRDKGKEGTREETTGVEPVRLSPVSEDEKRRRAVEAHRLIEDPMATSDSKRAAQRQLHVLGEVV